MKNGAKLHKAKWNQCTAQPSSFRAKTTESNVVANLTKLTKPPTVISPEDMGTLKRKHRRKLIPATSTMSLNTIERFDTEDELDNKASPREESIL